MNKIVNFALLGSLILSSGLVYSGNTTGTVSVIEVQPIANMAYVSLNGTNNSPPSCNTTNRYVLDISTNSGRVVYSGLLAAKTTNQPVTIYGAGACTLSAATGSEDFSVMRQ